MDVDPTRRLRFQSVLRMEHPIREKEWRRRRRRAVSGTRALMPQNLRDLWN